MLSWKYCKKNPGYEKFICSQYFIDNSLPRLESDKKRKVFRSLIDLTIRLRVSRTSLGRPAGDEIATYRGTDTPRLGTGFICGSRRPVYDKRCFCRTCCGKIARKKWRFDVRTACHVVYNTEEAERTTIDLFYDDDMSDKDERMKFVYGAKMLESESDTDWCKLLFVTCDKHVGERIMSAVTCWLDDELLKPQDLLNMGLLPSCDKNCKPVLIVSHAHGQPKKITVGELKSPDEERPRIHYSTPTCPGSSGAPVFVYDSIIGNFSYVMWVLPVHNGSFDKTSTHSCNHQLNDETALEEQLNYGQEGW
ncbi:hypothetical protein ElyMa_005019900 [Elysia marginata]|uniref:Peptidase S1 domain-containing protein n=1 Tax=Elysia marginata TaxID=1093978 RepID=A0AAV4J856_9GAST|nr:hypothetical protein ElyMa_005019900 [Elysia marginata]